MNTKLEMLKKEYDMAAMDAYIAQTVADDAEAAIIDAIDAADADDAHDAADKAEAEAQFVYDKLQTELKRIKK